MGENVAPAIEIDNHAHGLLIADGKSYRPGLDHCFSRSKDGVFMGGVIFVDYQIRSILIHVRAVDPRWLCRDLLWLMFDWAFNQCMVDKVVGFVPSTNQHALDFDKRIGFVEETRIKGMIPGGDYVVLSMYREQCRWLAHRPKSIRHNVPKVFQ